jgi:hypothetical protein
VNKRQDDDYAVVDDDDAEADDDNDAEADDDNDAEADDADGDVLRFSLRHAFGTIGALSEPNGPGDQFPGVASKPSK